MTTSIPGPKYTRYSRGVTPRKINLDIPVLSESDANKHTIIFQKGNKQSFIKRIKHRRKRLLQTTQDYSNAGIYYSRDDAEKCIDDNDIIPKQYEGGEVFVVALRDIMYECFEDNNPSYLTGVTLDNFQGFFFKSKFFSTNAFKSEGLTKDYVLSKELLLDKALEFIKNKRKNLSEKIDKCKNTVVIYLKQIEECKKFLSDSIPKINDGSNSFNIMKDAFESKINNGLADFERTKAQLERDETDLKMFSDCQNRLKPNSISFIEGLEESEYFGQLAREESEYLSTKG